jgi:hypothetical protein
MKIVNLTVSRNQVPSVTKSAPVSDRVAARYLLAPSPWLVPQKPQQALFSWGGQRIHRDFLLKFDWMSNSASTGSLDNPLAVAPADGGFVSASFAAPSPPLDFPLVSLPQDRHQQRQDDCSCSPALFLALFASLGYGRFLPTLPH